MVVLLWFSLLLAVGDYFCVIYTFCFGVVFDQFQVLTYYLVRKNKVHTLHNLSIIKSNRKAMNKNWSNQTANRALKTKTGNK